MSDSIILKGPADYPHWLSRFHDAAGELYDYASPKSLMTKEEALLAYLGPEPVAPVPDATVSEFDENYWEARKEWCRRKDRFEDKCQQLMEWLVSSIDDNAYAVTWGIRNIRDKAQALDDEFAVNIGVLKRLALRDYEQIKRQFKLSNVSVWKLSYKTVLRTLVKYDAAPVLDGIWLLELSTLIGKAGNETIKEQLIKMHQDPQYHDVLANFAEVSRKLDVAETVYWTQHPHRRGAAYAAELSITEDAPDTPVVSNAARKRRRAATTQRPPDRQFRYE
ncbi:hypothetical protein SEPCBS57363_001739 [Sporothrix epigloea]|uniref:Uncharacterized protein n=1 Tax=Sporothrix epigloea TaxID=1892477 RepID=A0ABP0DBZ9_9PEZI